MEEITVKYIDSTEGVTLYAAFVNDVLAIYEHKKEEMTDLFALAKDLDLSDPFNKVDMNVYNEMCDWLEKNLGKFNLIKAGRKIGETAYQGMIKHQLITSDSSPKQVMEALQKVASTMIQDPQGRGWEILDAKPKSILMRRTQTFNGKLQIGLLDGLVRKTKVSGVKVDFVKERELGNEFDEYLITWI